MIMMGELIDAAMEPVSAVKRGWLSPLTAM